MGENLELQQLVDDEAEEEIILSQPTKCSCPYLGLILATLSSLFFSLCSVIVKWMTEVDPMALAAYRYLGVLLPAIPIVIYKGEPVFPKGKRIMLLLRSFTGTAALMLSFYAFRHMPLADASVIVFSVPVFTAIFARMFLKEPCGLFGAFSVMITLIGVVLITRPPILFGNAIGSLGESDGRTEIWSAVAAFSATLLGERLCPAEGAQGDTLLGDHDELRIVCARPVFAGDVGDRALCVPRCGIDRYLIVALAFFSFLGQILLTLALQLEQAGPVAIARSSDIVFAFGWQVLFFKEIPNLYSILGAILVMSSVLLTGVRKWILALPENSSLRYKFGFLAKKTLFKRLCKSGRPSQLITNRTVHLSHLIRVSRNHII